jgi:hypothetical protein
MDLWKPEKILNPDQIKTAGKLAVIVLNRPINAEKEIVKSLWDQGEIAAEFSK